MYLLHMDLLYVFITYGPIICIYLYLNIGSFDENYIRHFVEDIRLVGCQ